jgi:transcriptional regulator with XRE-family HTH domain
MLDLKRFRKAKNIQQKDIVKLLEISQAYVSDMERGLKPVSKESYDKLYSIYGDKLKQFEKPNITSESKEFYVLRASNQELEQKVKHLEERIKDKEETLKAKDALIDQLQRSLDEYKKHMYETFVNFQQEVKKYIHCIHGSTPEL